MICTDGEDICTDVLNVDWDPDEILYRLNSSDNEWSRGLKFKQTHPDAVLPERAHENDSGYDVRAVEYTIIPARSKAVVPVGFEFAYIPEGWWVRVEARSGLSFKHSIIPHNGIIDNGYRGDCGILLYNHSDKDYNVSKGDKIAQLVLYPLIATTVEWTENKTQTDRNENGFGSTGK
jgi:dUTP pyrophosphatase